MVGQPPKSAPGHTKKDISDWTSADVASFLEEALPGHPCHHNFRYTTGYVLADLNKDDIRRQASNDEAANVIWGELHKHRRIYRETPVARDERGEENLTVFVRTPAESMIELEVKPVETIASMKSRLSQSAGVPVEHMRLVWNGVNLSTDDRVVSSYRIPHGAILRLIPQLAGSGKFVPPPAPRGLLMVSGNKSWQPAHASKPYMPIVCSDEYRPFPMAVEFDTVGDYKHFMEVASRQEATLTEQGGVTGGPPLVELLPVSGGGDSTQTRAYLDNDTEMLRLDTVGDIGENARREGVLRLGNSQKRIFVVTGDRIGRTQGI